MASLLDLLAASQPSRMGMIEGDPEYDPWSMQAARYRARAPTRPAGPAAVNASRGVVGFSDLPGVDEARRQAGNVYAGEDYNPSSLLQMAVGAVGAPGLVGGVPGLGSGVGRAKAVMRPLAPSPDVPPIRAYHGSPYDFERFDMSKIGTGEGAQAYGHGLYFAEHEPVALSYKQSTTDLRDWPVTGGKEGWRVPSWAAKTAMTSPAGLDQVAREFAMRARNMKMEGHWNAAGIQEIADALQAVKQGKAELKKPGTMYEVGIRAQPEQFLDWDRPIAEQNQNLLNTIADVAATGRVPLGNSATGQTAYRALEDKYGRGSLTAGKPIASEVLRDAGVPGIRYLDQGSRGGGQGTSNYVLFRDDIIDILRKYGLAGLAAMPALGQMAQPDQR